MVSIDEAVISRYKRDGKVFEILVDCEKAMLFREEKETELDDVVVTRDVFTDVKKGMHAPEKDLQAIFGTTDKNEICKFIVTQGDVQLTADYQKKLREEKRKQIIALIHKNAIDARTGFPLPPQRIENAMAEAKVNIDAFKSAEAQSQDVIKKLREILPLKYEIREIAIKIPMQFSGKSFGLLKQFGRILKDEWQNNGDLIAVVEVPAGLTQDFFDELNKMTHGNVETKIVAKK
ncbi:MAG: ribosome assembly factor SBDS [Nanoarchaeota archaeon]